eukprot:SAG11_NODE_14287_length_618_cov_0.990366_1_plen_75_part_00
MSGKPSVAQGEIEDNELESEDPLTLWIEGDPGVVADDIGAATRRDRLGCRLRLAGRDGERIVWHGSELMRRTVW